MRGRFDVPAPGYTETAPVDTDEIGGLNRDTHGFGLGDAEGQNAAR